MVIVYTIVILSLIIFIHELGHLIIAKFWRINVLNFSVGFGPKILKKKIGDTEYALSLIPFGGYVKMKGDEPKKDGKYEPDDFLARPVHQRISVVAAGPLFNLVLGFIVYVIAYSSFGVSTIPGNIVRDIENNSPAELAGILPGDKIVKVDGNPFENWYKFFGEIEKKTRVNITVLRDKKTVRLSLDTRGDNPGIVPLIPPKIDMVQRGSPAEEIGIKRGAIILSIGGKDISDWTELQGIVQTHPGESLDIKWRQNGEIKEAVIVPEITMGIRDGKEVEIGKIGVFLSSERARIGFFGSLNIAFSETVRSTYLIFYVLYKLLTRKISVKTIGGPLLIGKMIGETASLGLFNLLLFIGLISINLCVINFIPIPALDGGHILLFTIEKIRRKPVSPKLQEVVQYIGFGLIILLMLVITLFDILRFTK